MAGRRLLFADEARAGRIRRRRRAARRQEPSCGSWSPAIGQVTLNDYDERAAAGSAYGQVRIRSGLATDRDARRTDRPLDADRATTASPWVTAEFRVSERTRCAAAAACIASFPISRRFTAFTAAAAACSRSARCTSMPGSSRRCLARRACSSTSTRATRGTCCGRPARSRGSRRRHDQPGLVQRAVDQRTARRSTRRRSRGPPRCGRRVLGLGRLCLRPAAVQGHETGESILGRRGPAAHAVAVRELSSVEPREPEREI